MSGAEITFSDYAIAFYEIIDGKKSDKAVFVKDLLKMGLGVNGIEIINDMFPELCNQRGEKVIEKNKADQLRKYLRGDNGIKNIANELKCNFDEASYCENLQEYDESKLVEFAKEFHLDADEEDIDEVSEAIAELYFSIIEAATTKNGIKPKRLKDEVKSDENSIELSYTITDTDKNALINLFRLIKRTLSDLRHQTETICNKQHELEKLTGSETDNRWKPHLEYDIKSSVKHFDEAYSKIEKLCTDLIKLLEPKKDMESSIASLISIAESVKNDEYKSMCPDKYDYSAFWRMISQFNDCINRTARFIEKLLQV